MRSTMKKIENLLNARINCIWVETYEESHFIDNLRKIIPRLKGALGLKIWSISEGMRDISLGTGEIGKPVEGTASAPSFFSIIQEAQEDKNTKVENIYIVRDYHQLVDNPIYVRRIRDLKEYSHPNYNPIIVLSPMVRIPIEHEKLFTVVSYDLPDEDEIQKVIDAVSLGLDRRKVKGYAVPSADEKTALVRAAKGLTINELNEVLAKSIIEHKALLSEVIMEEKMQLVKKSDVLEFSTPRYSLKDMGGNKTFKEWVKKVKAGMTSEAIEYGFPSYKGYLALGVPGTSKTMGAEIMANELGVPLLRLSMDRIMDKHVGNSEKKIAQAFRIANAVAPCVFLWDEIEKMLGGVSSSNSSDAGTTNRVYSACLNFLQENTNVFVVMTSNDFEQIPDALIRQGRIDQTWYFPVPTEKEAIEIFRIHLKDTGLDYSEKIPSVAARHCRNFTGAEIKNVVKNAVRESYFKHLDGGNKEITEDNIINAAKEVIPMYRSHRQLVHRLEAQAASRALYANRQEHQETMDENLVEDVLKLQLD